MRKNIRLPKGAYSGVGNIFHITICTKNSEPVFARPSIATMAIEVLKERAAFKQVPVYAYCFMPDHAHLVIGAGPECAVDKFVDRYKSVTAQKSWPLGVKGSFWQERFYDRAIRFSEEDLTKRCMYALENPVRGGLVDEWQRYPYSGSLVWPDLRE